MKNIKCKNCGQSISQRAPACPACGHPNPEANYMSGGQVFFGLLVAAGGIWFMATRDGSGSLSMPDLSAVASSTPAASSAPMLQLKSFRCEYEHGYATLVGEVTNITQRKLEGVMVVASHYTKGAELIVADDSFITYQPILPGQVSPFKVMTTYNPAMKSCSVNFKSLSGGPMRWKQKDGTVVN